MTNHPAVTGLCLALLLLPGGAQAGAGDRGAGDADPPVVVAAEGEWESDEPAEVGATAPAPPPATAIPPPPPQASAGAPPPAGQWVDTQQYGRIWIPYADAYTYAPPSGYGEPYEYVYYPSYGWTWVVAPWIWGWGPWPVFGYYGAARYGWYGHGWWRTPARWHYAPSYRTGGYAHGLAPAPHPGHSGGRVVGPPTYRSSSAIPHGQAVRGGGATGRGGGGHVRGGRP